MVSISQRAVKRSDNPNLKPNNTTYGKVRHSGPQIQPPLIAPLAAESDERPVNLQARLGEKKPAKKAYLGDERALS